MHTRYFIRSNTFITGLTLLLACITSASFGQANTTDCSKVLDQEPYFARHQSLLPTDSLLIKDILILKHCGSFDEIDSELLKGSVLTALMRDEVNEGKPATYRTILDFISAFKKTQEYQEFKDGVLLYRTLENKKVSLKDWDKDQKLFIRMGFTQNDLDDFKGYISGPQVAGLTYKEAYLKYIKEIEEPAKGK